MLWFKRKKPTAKTREPEPELPPEFNLDVPEWWPRVEGVPQPDWERIYDYISSALPPEECAGGYTAAALYWLRKLGGALGEDYKVFASDEYLLLSTRSPESARDLLKFCESTEATICEMFELTQEDLGYGKGVVLLFPDVDSYYQYHLSQYPDEGEFAGSGGAYVPWGYGHIILPDGEPWAVTATLTHEIVHSCLARLGLPLWMEEGMIRVIERKVGRYGQDPALTPELRHEHLRYWTPPRLQDFWSGKAFSMPDPAQKLSYSLSEILVLRLLEEHREAFADFIHSASAEDAGEAAAHDVFGFGVGDLAATFLGDGEWAPDPPAAEDTEPSPVLPAQFSLSAVPT